MLDRFSATIQLIYAAAGGGATWSDALIAIEDLTGSSAAVINLVPKSSEFAPKNLVGSILRRKCCGVGARIHGNVPTRCRWTAHAGRSLHLRLYDPQRS